MSQTSYETVLAVSEKIRWKVEDIIGGEKRLDFQMPFLPEALARLETLTFLSDQERRILNQIRGHEYLCLFGLVEEFILPFVLDHARPQLAEDDHRTRALLTFAEEEAKHIHLFKRFREEFENGFGHSCEVIGPPEAIGKAVLAHDPLAVALTILHVEWMTQRHYTDSVKDAADLDPQFKSLLKHHWMEEAQHAKLDMLMVEALAAGKSEDEIRSAFVEYLEIGGFLNEGLEAQARLNADAFERAIGRALPDAERQELVTAMEGGLRWTYLGSGMTHPTFAGMVEQLSPWAKERLDEVAPAFC